MPLGDDIDNRNELDNKYKNRRRAFTYVLLLILANILIALIIFFVLSNTVGTP